MTTPETPAPKPAPSIEDARIRNSRTLRSTVWLIPLLAALTGAWLLVQNARSKGPEITLLMDNAEGIEVNTTAVKVLNVEVGRVVNIRLRDDQSGVEITARMNKDVAPLMRKDTQFWVVKPRIDQNGITGLGTLVSGSYIAFTPGKSNEEASEVTVSDLPPVAAIGQSGLRLFLSGKNGKMVNVGSPVLYENHIVGTVESADFAPADQTVRYTVFIHSPNESLLSADSRFWLDSGLRVQTGGGGLSIDSPPLSALLSGAISFSTPSHAGSSTQSVSSGQNFKIYNNRAEVENLPGPRTLYYTVFFQGSVRGLESGAPVEYTGLRIGSVAAVPHFAAGDSLKLLENGWVPVRIRIDPERLEAGAEPQSREYWQQAFQAASGRGLAATIGSNNLILGSKMIELSEESGNLLRPHAEYAGDPVLASRSGGDLQDQVGKLLAKLNDLPLEKTVGELNGNLRELRQTLKNAQRMMGSAENTLNSANRLIGSPSTQQLPAELKHTLQQLRQTLGGISPQSPLYQDAQQTLDSIDRTLRDAQPLLNTLKEQPNALIFKRSAQDPTPKGSR